MSMPGPMELIIIFLVILLLFGAKRIPEILKSFGEGVKEFKKGMSNLTDTNSNQSDSASKPAQKQPDSTEEKK
jgi:sec-independent protein translocase protein TatA